MWAYVFGAACDAGDLSKRLGQIRTARNAGSDVTVTMTRADAALRDGHITPALSGWAKALCMQDAASFETFIARSPAPYAHLHRQLVNGVPPVQRSETALASQEEATICAQLGLKPEALRD